MTKSGSAWLGRHGPIPCVVWGAHTGHIETNTLHHIIPHSSNSLVEGDPGGGENYTILSIPWVEEWGHKTPTVLNHKQSVPGAGSLVTTDTMHCTVLLNTCPQSPLCKHAPSASLTGSLTTLKEYFQINLSVFCVMS